MISFPCDSHQSLVVRKVIGFTVKAARMSLHPADVSYSCGSCGYPLNLTSSDRITSGIGSEYRKSIKKGFISFLSVDRSRFTQVDQVSCFPVAWGCKRLKTKLLCRKCGVHIGYGYGDSLALCGFDSPNLSTLSYKKFTIKIRALQPSEDC